MIGYCILGGKFVGDLNACISFFISLRLLEFGFECNVLIKT